MYQGQDIHKQNFTHTTVSRDELKVRLLIAGRKEKEIERTLLLAEKLNSSVRIGTVCYAIAPDSGIDLSQASLPNGR